MNDAGRARAPLASLQEEASKPPRAKSRRGSLTLRRSHTRRRRCIARRPSSLGHAQLVVRVALDAIAQRDVRDDHAKRERLARPRARR